MKYYKILMRNGYCGCDEIELVALSDNEDVEEYAYECLVNNYGFYEPDFRFIGEMEDYDTEEEYYEEYEEYQNNLTADIEELTYEQYIAERDNYGIIP